MSKMPHRLKHLGLFTLCGLLAACQTFTDGDRQLREQSDRLFEDALAQSRQSQTPPPAVQAALLPPLLPETTVPSGGPRFDVAAHDMDARAFFLSLMESAGQNLVVHPEVSGTITFSLRNVTLDEVLAAVRDTYGYDFQRTSYGYRILPNQLLTRTYDLNYLNVQREGTSDTRVSSGQVTTSDDTGTSDSGTTTSTTASTVNASQVLTSSKVDFWHEVGDVVTALIGDEEGNKVVVNPQASLLVVRASSRDQQNVEAFLKQAEQNLQRQVILEAKILEVRLSDQFQAGINWTQLGSKLDLDLSGEALSGASGIGGVFSALYSSGDFTALLQLLETQGQVRVLSSPRVSTLNNQKAVIKVGTDEYFVTDVSTTTTTLAGGTTAPDLDITLTPFFSGISLDVTPQINRQEDVTLHVRPTVSRVQDQNKTITLGSDDNVFNLPLALSTTRQSDSIVRARSGQVVVIGGLLEDINDNTDAGVPWLSKLPFLGWFFQQQRKDLVRSELVILLRPQVIGADTWLDELQKSAASFRELR